MSSILFIYAENLAQDKLAYLNALERQFDHNEFDVIASTDLDAAVRSAKSNPRIHCIVLDWEDYDLSAFDQIADFNPNLPIFAVSNSNQDIQLKLHDFNFNLGFLQFDAGMIDDSVDRILQAIDDYQQAILPPFTRQLMHYVAEHNYSFCTPGHQGGHGFQKTPVGAMFYDFYGPNVFKSDISISMSEMGSLLEHSGPHGVAEKSIAETFGADRSLIVTNGTSTSNKIVGMYAAGDGDTILVDRNCHKSIAQFMTMVDVNPIYLRPTRNAHGILGGIPKDEFTKASITAKIKQHPTAKSWPTYAVVTNSTYDGLFYNIKNIQESLDVNHLHFDSAWVPYTHFHPIYNGKYGLSVSPKAGQTIFETQSTHKLLAAFSQASMIHVKGAYDEEIINESFMMHTSTSPFYPIVASCEISAAMLKGRVGYHLINDTIECAMDFRREIVKLNQAAKTWFYEVWQPEGVVKADAWALKPADKWHGFKDLDADHLYLDPVKVTLLLPGIKNNQLEQAGIPAAIVAPFLEDHGIIVEKTGPYSMLFLFSVGITRAKSMQLLAALNKFKQLYDDNAEVKDVLPGIYQAHPQFYSDKKIQDIAQSLHEVMVKHKLPDTMYHAFDKLPELIMNPHQAYQKLIKRQTRKICIDDLVGQTSAVMVLPYPPGIPLILPGEKITKDTQVILEFLLMLEEIGAHLPGFETEIHGLEQGDDGRLYIKIISD